MTELKVITYDSPEYEKMVALRYKILREPLGLVFTEQDLEKDKDDILLTASFSGSDEMIGCCILSPLNEHTIQLRQMAVDDFCQRKGLGSELLLFAEQIATDRDYKYVYLHARKIAVDFYKKHGYTIEGDQFTEVGIPHFEMIKRI
jgi:predicted GNAT family N-acyltransferase